MTVRKHKILSDAEIDGNLKANSVTVPSIQNGVLVTDAQGNIIADQTVSIDDLHSIPTITADVQQVKDDLTQEIQDREDADTALDTKFTGLIGDEATAREAADTALQGNIDAEVFRATMRENQIASDLTYEMTTREAGDQYLAIQVAEEEARAKAAEADLQDQIDALDSDKLDKNPAITAGTHTKITYDAKGLVTAGADLTASDIPDIAISQVTGLQDELDDKAPESHADATDKYGAGTASQYGHVMVDDAISDSSTNPVQNQVIKEYVDDAVSTNTANYISDNGQPFASPANLPTDPAVVSNNDYAFVTGVDAAGNTFYDRYKATVSNNVVTWAKEYRLNNSSFTTAQWNAISSGITAGKVADYDAHIADTDIHVTTADKSNWNNKVDKLTISPAGTYPKVTVNSQGQVVSGTTLVESDIPQLPISKITDLQTELDDKLDDDQLVTSFQQTPDDTHIPSEKLVKDSLDEKVKGPASATRDNVALFDGTTGKIIKDSGKTLGASIPAPTVADKDKALIVNATGNGFIFGEAGSVDDVQINNGVSIVTNKVAQIPFRTTKIQLTEVD